MSDNQVVNGVTRLRLLISGRVQGVGYRAWLTTEARRLGVTGWVRNLVDGRVEALLQGETARLERLAEACADGPAGALVSRVDRLSSITGSDSETSPAGFEQR